MRKTQVLQEWVTNGPARTWDAEFKDFADGALNTVRATLNDTSRMKELGAERSRVDLEQLKIRPSQRYRTGTQDFVQKFSGLVGISTPVATAVAASTGAIAGPLLAIPAGVTILAGLVFGVIKRNKTRSTALGILRQEWIDGLDEAAKEFREGFVAAASLRGKEIIDRAIELLSERRDELSRKIIMVENRLAEPDHTDKSNVVARLEPYSRTGEELLSELKRFTSWG